MKYDNKCQYNVTDSSSDYSINNEGADDFFFLINIRS